MVPPMDKLWWGAGGSAVTREYVTGVTISLVKRETCRGEFPKEICGISLYADLETVCGFGSV